MFPGPEGACAFSGVRDGEELPIPLESSERAGSQVNEGDVRAGHEVTHGSGHHDLRRLRLAYDARGDVPADPGHVPSLQIDLTGVHSRADVETHAAELGAKRIGETDRLLRGLEHHELAVAEVLHHSTAEPPSEFLGKTIVSSEELSPAAVAQLLRPFGRAHDVGEHHRSDRSAEPPAHGSGRLDLDDRIVGPDVEPVDAEDHAPQQHQPGGPEGGERPWISVLERSVANQQSLADEETVHDHEQDGMDRQPALPAAILERGSVRCRHEDRAVGSHTPLRIESSV
jgi:hypothetical protein